MLKKHLLVSAVAMGLSSIALANGSIAPVATAACDTEYTPGVYFGLQGGAIDSGLKAIEGVGEDLDIQLFKVDKEYGVAGRVFLGYDINKYFAIEAGYLFGFQKTELGFIDELGVNQHFADIRTQAVDLVGKLKAPITDNFGLYAKLGPGYLMQRYTATVGDENSDDTNKFDVVYGAGAYYTFASNWNVDLSWTRYNSGHTKMNLQDWQPVVDFYALGISYKFDMPV